MNSGNVEIEKKYIIAMPDVDVMKGMENYGSSEILQIYLPGEKGTTHRIRQRSYADSVKYFETVKVRIDQMSANEFEREISKEDFDILAASPKEGTRPIKKTRHTFLYMKQLFEIDVYPEWSRTAIMETELASRDTSVEFPEFIKIIREVTGDRRYSNAGMSHDFPREDDYL